MVTSLAWSYISSLQGLWWKYVGRAAFKLNTPDLIVSWLSEMVILSSLDTRTKQELRTTFFKAHGEGVCCCLTTQGVFSGYREGFQSSVNRLNLHWQLFATRGAAETSSANNAYISSFSNFDGANFLARRCLYTYALRIRAKLCFCTEVLHGIIRIY